MSKRIRNRRRVVHSPSSPFKKVIFWISYSRPSVSIKKQIANAILYIVYNEFPECAGRIGRAKSVGFRCLAVGSTYSCGSDNWIEGNSLGSEEKVTAFCPANPRVLKGILDQYPRDSEFWLSPEYYDLAKKQTHYRFPLSWKLPNLGERKEYSFES